MCTGGGGWPEQVFGLLFIGVPGFFIEIKEIELVSFAGIWYDSFCYWRTSLCPDESSPTLILQRMPRCWARCCSCVGEMMRRL